jgi:hypothetical protein
MEYSSAIVQALGTGVFMLQSPLQRLAHAASTHGDAVAQVRSST